MVKFSPQRMTVQLEQQKIHITRSKQKSNFDAKEQVIIREAKQANAREFFGENQSTTSCSSYRE